MTTGESSSEKEATADNSGEKRLQSFRLKLAYDGTQYHGWQVQPNGRTIQQELIDAIRHVTGATTNPVASGRTDAGVHALAQIVHVHIVTRLSPDALRKALNAQLPPDIVVVEADEVPTSFDAQRDARWKLYRYVFDDGPVANVFLQRFAWHVRGPLDVGAMARAAEFLEGTHDFRCFESEWPNRATSVRTVRRCRVTRVGELVYLDVEADGFLYNMVRAIAGTLREVGRHRFAPEATRAILESGDRSLAGPTAPARGLFLVRVEYGPSGASESSTQS